MNLSTKNAAWLASITLLAVVLLQLVYMGLRSTGTDFDSADIWIWEAIDFSIIALCGLLLMVRSKTAQTAAAAIALGGIFNVVQVGMGMAMFPPLQDGGEALAGVYQSVLAGAFWLYFIGKALFGIAALLLGVALVRQAELWPRIIGGLAVISGLGALLVNTFALRQGMSMVFPAGATGTAATFFLAIALVMVVKREQAAES